MFFFFFFLGGWICLLLYCACNGVFGILQLFFLTVIVMRLEPEASRYKNVQNQSLTEAHIFLSIKNSPLHVLLSLFWGPEDVSFFFFFTERYG